MDRISKRFWVFGLAVGSFLCASAQLESNRYNADAPGLPAWVQLMHADEPDPGAVEAAYDAYYATHPFQKNGHTQYYKRWKRELGHDLVPMDAEQKAGYAESLSQYLEATQQLAWERAANWSCIGPFDWDHGSVAKSYACGAAHVYAVEQSATDPDLIYAGTANSGLWKSVDKGMNWTNVTKSMLIGQVLALEIDRSDEDIVYFGSEGSLWRTLDGGNIWNAIGGTTFQAVSHSIRDIVQHPTDHQILYVISNQGLWRSTNAGTSLAQVQGGVWQELEFKPGDPNTVYAIKQNGNRTEFWRSTNNGVSFASIGTGWPAPVAPDEQERTEIAVSPAEPNSVFALCTGSVNGGSGLYGVYKSLDQGMNWTFQCCGPSPGGAPSPTNFNLMGWSDEGQDDGGQYYYDLAFDVDPTNANNMTVCGVNRWVSTDGGATFSCPAKWSHSNKVDYVHADIHDFRYSSGTEIWAACDGGIFYSDDGGSSFNKRMFGISGTDFWGFGVGGWTGSNVMLGGAYHNGTLLKDNDVYTNGWVSTDGGDGFRGFVHPQYDRRALSDWGYKTLSGDRTVANANSSWDKQPNASYITGESSEVVWHPNLVDAAYVGNGTAIWMTTDNGGSFTQLVDLGEKVTRIEVAHSDPNVIYACTWPDWWGTKKVWRSTNAGADWTEITPSSTQLNGNIWVPYDITVSGSDPQTLWLVRTSQYGNSPNMNGYVVYKSVDGGTTWANVTDANLNGEWPTNIAHQLGSSATLYIGTRRAVYTHMEASPAWSLWNAGLPAKIFSTRLLINYRDGKIRNGTDRSIWESALEESAAPLANFAADKRTVTCYDPEVRFWDNSALSGDGATWSWSFPGGIPTSSTVRDPMVTYAGPGVYDVSLTVTDIHGTSSRTIPGFITVLNSNATVPVLEDAENGSITPEGWGLENPDGLATWTNVALTVGANGGPTRAWRIDNYYYNAVGQEDRLVSPVISLAGSSGTHLLFHHAYAPYGASYPDGLRVEVSSNCGVDWTVLFDQAGAMLATAPNNSSPWAPTMDLEWMAHDIDLSAFDGQSVVVRFTAINAYGNRLYLDNLELRNEGMRLALKMMLEGPYDINDQLMRDDLRAMGLIPTTEPCTALEFTHVGGGGGEVIHTGTTAATGNDAIVDWVLVELRDATDPSSILATRSALLQRDGDVVATDGTSPLSFSVASGDHHVALRHRNHLGVMTASPVSLSTSITALDLTDPLLATHGSDARKNVANTMVLWAGNTVNGAPAPGLLKYTGENNDRDPILVAVGGVVPTNTMIGYRSEDVNMDGVTKYTGIANDRDPILVNVGGVILTNTRPEQLP